MNRFSTSRPGVCSLRFHDNLLGAVARIIDAAHQREMPPKKSIASKSKAKRGAPRASDAEDAKAIDQLPEAVGPGAPVQEDDERKDKVLAIENSNSKDEEAAKTRLEKPSAKTNKRKNAEKVAESNKAIRQSSRRSMKPNATQLLNYLLSPAVTTLCLPKDEEERPPSANTRTYTTHVPLSPFEELLCSMVLSRPISHRLGQRAIKTLLNEPYSFTTPKALRDAGPEKREQALWDARTQHKQKTADQLGGLADVVIDQFSNGEDDNQLSRLRSESNKEMETMRQNLQSSIKGVGKTGLDIFFRRVQGWWAECYPFVDPKTEDSVAKLGLPRGEEELQVFIDQHWSDLKIDDINGGEDSDMSKRLVLVRILERAVNADLENKIDDLLDEAAKS